MQFSPPDNLGTLVFLYQLSYPGSQGTPCEGFKQECKTAKNADFRLIHRYISKTI